jgi:hypothetical protein
MACEGHYYRLYQAQARNVDDRRPNCVSIDLARDTPKDERQ